jgi:hypothetical protein
MVFRGLPRAGNFFLSYLALTLRTAAFVTRHARFRPCERAARGSARADLWQLPRIILAPLPRAELKGHQLQIQGLR